MGGKVLIQGDFLGEVEFLDEVEAEIRVLGAVVVHLVGRYCLGAFVVGE